MFSEENNIGNMDAKQARKFAVRAELGLSDFGFGITTAGTICMGDKILIDKRDLHYPWFTKQLILHEIAHHLSPEDDRHGTRFHKKYAELVNRFLAGRPKRADELKILVMSYWRFSRNCPIVASEYNYGDADVLAVTSAGMRIETEVKVSLADLKRDGAKTKHFAMQRELGLVQDRPSRYPFMKAATRSHYFYFAVPETLKEKALEIVTAKYPYAGLLVVKPIDPEVNPSYHPPVYSARKAHQFRSKPKLTYDQTMDVVKGMSTTLCHLGMELIQK